MALRIVFMGTPEFAMTSLDRLVQHGFNVVSVVTVPDKPAGRGQKIQFSAVKQYAVDKNIQVLQPEKLKDFEFLEQLRALNADLFIVVAFRMLPEVVWSMPRLGTFNLHGSLLPQYRGAAPINWAVINGEKETGVTTFFIEKKIDTGKILFSDRIAIGELATAGQIHDELMEVGANLVVKTVKAIETGNIQPVSQENIIKEKELKSAPKIFKEDCRIHWSESTEKVYNLIRGLSPYPAAWSVMNGGEGEQSLSVKIFETEKELEKVFKPAGTIVTDGKKFLKIITSDGSINVKSLQAEGKKRLSIEEFLRGFHAIEKYKFS